MVHESVAEQIALSGGSEDIVGSMVQCLDNVEKNLNKEFNLPAFECIGIGTFLSNVSLLNSTDPSIASALRSLIGFADFEGRAFSSTTTPYPRGIDNKLARTLAPEQVDSLVAEALKEVLSTATDIEQSGESGFLLLDLFTAMEANIVEDFKASSWEDLAGNGKSFLHTVSQVVASSDDLRDSVHKCLLQTDYVQAASSPRSPATKKLSAAGLKVLQLNII